MINVLYFITITSFLFLSNAHGSLSDQFIDPEDGMLDASKFIAENAYGFLPIPIIISEPAVEKGGGMIGLFFHESDKEKNERMQAAKTSEIASKYLLPPSLTAVAGAKTGNGSWLLGIGHIGFWLQDHVRYLGYLGYGLVNLGFYGTSEFSFSQGHELGMHGFGEGQRVLFRIMNSSFFVGIKQVYTEANINLHLDNLYSEFPSIPPILVGKIINYLKQYDPYKTKNSAAGIILKFDNRDNIFTPRNGGDYKLEWLSYNEKFGGDFDYADLIIETKNYFSLMDTLTLGLRAKFENLNNNKQVIPPYALPGIDMRGIPAARYQANTTALIESQLSWDMNRRWMFSTFGGVARIAKDRFNLLQENSENLITRGVGFKYQIARRYIFYSGIDFATGPEGFNFYIKAGSSW